MKYLFLILLLTLTIGFSQAQITRVNLYYLADTINVSPSNRILSIENEGRFCGYVFFCRCIQNNKYVHPAFIYDINKTKTENFTQKPNLTYLTWKELEDLLYSKQQTFDRFYSLEVVEKLPDGRYKKNKVNLAKPIVKITY